MKSAPPTIICCKQNNHIKKYIRGRHLGVGGFANVYSVESMDTHRVYGCKVINKSMLKRKEHRNKLISEIKLHQTLQHKHIVKFFRYFDDCSYVYILLELCDNNSMMELIRNRHKLTEYEVRYFMKQIIIALNYLHSKSIIHRDLKLGNILLDEKLNIKLCDFGLATQVEDGMRKTTICGTPNYIAPEILNQRRYGQGHSYEVDIWSLGVIMFTMLTGTPPFETKNIEETYRRINKTRYQWPLNVDISISAKHLVAKILNIDPMKRPNLYQIETDDFFKQEIPKELPLWIIKRMPSKHEIFINNDDSKSMNNERKNEEFIFVVKHCDYSKKYGIGYILSNGFTGIYFNDSTKMLLHRDKEHITYIDDANEFKYCSRYNFPQNLAKKVKLLEYFSEYLWNKTDIKIDKVFNEKVFVRKWLKEKYAMLFRLTDHTVQVNFTDSSKLVFQDSAKVMYQQKNGEKQIYTMEQIYQSNKKDLKKRFKYTLQLLKKIQSNK